MFARLCSTALIAGCLAGCSDDPCGGDPPESDVPPGHVLLHPDTAAMKVVPPDTFDVRFETTEGDIVVRVYRSWSPLGVYRFYNLARHGYYDGSRFFRVLPGFAAQFGLSGRPAIDAVWAEQSLTDDPPFAPNTRGTLAFATAGPDTRSTQLFFNYRDNPTLDEQGFTPFGRIVTGYDALLRLHSGYGEVQPAGTGPYYGCMLTHGNNYLDKRYPELDYIHRLVLLE
jgi:peptidyl-prolyl cis-trans isomerase A (cyclophilin A)